MVRQAKESPLLGDLFDYTQGDDIRFEDLFHVPAQLIAWAVLRVEKKVAMSFHLLAIGGRVHNVANTYGLGRSAETPQELQQMKDGFEAKQGFPNFYGAIDATHINMDLSPREVATN
ncbi:hypothetical protein L7F22_034185 [Adiantum nelumboides]|nr:hypothetical protein [Adiantum nelumboides]